MKTKEPHILLIINPGSTTTKISLFQEAEQLFFKEVPHQWRDLEQFSSVASQEEYRFQCIMEALEEKKELLDSISAVVGRGGLLHPVASGVFAVNEDMLRDLKDARYGEHASNLGAVIAHRFSMALKVPAFIADPVVVDEMCPEARLSGMPELERRSIFHALNHKSSARKACEDLGIDYEDARLIVAHLGGGISVAAHAEGKTVDVNNALDGDGPFSPERSGGVPAGQLAGLVGSGKYSMKEIRKKICGRGGVFAYLGTKDMREAARMAEEGDVNASLVLRAMGYQISKEICGLSAWFSGEVDAVVLTGGASRLKVLTDDIISRVSFIAPVLIIPGEREMEALAENGMRVLTGKQDAMEYVRK